LPDRLITQILKWPDGFARARMGQREHSHRTAGDAADGRARLLAAVVETLADALADLVETAGHAAEAALPTRWLGGVVAACADLVGAGIKAAAAVVSGVTAGALRLLGGLLYLDGRLLRRGLGDLLSGTAGAIVYLAGVLLALVNRLLGLAARARPLSDDERRLLRAVFGDALALYNVRVVEGRAGVFDVNDRAFVLGNTIYCKRTDPRARPDILVHECVHVWQYQAIGARYTTDALGAQALLGAGAYDWQAEIARGRTCWDDFNKEAQAQLIQDLWQRGALPAAGAATAAAAFRVGDADHTALAQDALRSLRGAVNLRWSRRY
jgi:hypothetical protein